MTAATMLPAVLGDEASQSVCIRGNQVAAPALILPGASLAAAIDLGRYRLMGVILPANWATANLSFQASVDDTTYLELVDDANTAASVTGTANVFIAFRDATAKLFAAVRFLKVRSGTSGSPVVQSQSANTKVVLVLEPTPV